MAPLKTRAVHMSRLGTAIPGFFDFAKFGIFALALVLVIYSIFAMVINAIGDYCKYGTDDPLADCGSSWKFYFSQANQSYQYYGRAMPADRILAVVAFFFVYALKAFYYRKIRKLAAEADELITDISDYSIEIRGLPTDTTEKELRDFFKKQTFYDDGEKIEVKPVLINFVYKNLDRLEARSLDLKRLIGQYIDESHKDKVDNQKLESIGQKFVNLVDSTDKMLKEEYTMSREEKKRVDNFAYSAYVSFDTQKQADAVKEQLEVKGLGKIAYKFFGHLRGPLKCFKGARRHILRTEGGKKDGVFYVETAEKPEEIIYTSLGQTFWQRFGRKFLSLLITILLICGSFIGLTVLKVIEDDFKGNALKAFSIFVAIMIKIAGFIIAFLTPKLVAFEKPETTSLKYIGEVWRSSISVFLNSAILVCVVSYYLTDKKDLDNIYFTDAGVGGTLFMLVVLSIIEPFVSTFDAGLLISRIKIWKLKKDLVNNPSKVTLIQSEANNLYEWAEFKYSIRLAKYCNTLLLIFFTLSTFPIVSFLGIILLLIYYWSDKFFLLRLARIPEYCTTELALSMLRFIDIVFIAWAVRNLFNKAGVCNERNFLL